MPYAELASVTPTTMASTTRAQRTTESDVPEATPLSQSTIITIAISVGVLFLAAAFIVIITLLLCCSLYKKSKLVSASHPTTDGNHQNSQIVNSAAYRCNDGVQLVSNASYNKSSNSQMVNNQAYNISGSDEPYYSVIHDMK